MLASLAVATPGCRKESARAYGPVFVGRAATYNHDITGLIERGLRALKVDVRGKTILLKPNLVEFSHSTCVNTDPRVVMAAVEVFSRLGANHVMIGEGPGHRRDTLGLAEESGYLTSIERFESRFVDLNRDDVIRVSDFGLVSEFYLPASLLRADVIVSLAKMKTHHWAGATLSMKNYFGVVPGSIYGWPKNILHQWGIPQSIVALTNYLGPSSIGIIDGVVGMEGNGPIQGVPKEAGVVVLGTDLVSLDATCSRLMGLDPSLVPYLQISGFKNSRLQGIDQRGENPSTASSRFAVLPQFENLQLQKGG